MPCVLLDDISVCFCGIFSVWAFMYILILLTVGFTKSLETRVSCVLCFQDWAHLIPCAWTCHLNHFFAIHDQLLWRLDCLPPHKVTLLVLKHSNVRLDKLLRLSDQQAIYSRFIKKDYSNIAFEVRLCRQSSHLTVRWYSIKYQASLITLCPYPSAVQMNSNLLLPGPMQPRLPLHHGQSDKGMREDIMCSSHKSCL